ncbi:hypothetical protein [Streptomyces abikoensis]
MSCRPYSPRPARRPLLLTPEVEERLVELTRLGLAAGLVAEGSSVHRATFFRWLARGRAEAQARQEGVPARTSEEVFVVLYGRILQARAVAALRAVRRIQQAAAGGFVLTTRTRAYRDAVTGAVVEETRVHRAPPDWRAGSWLLERQFPGDYGRHAAARDPFEAEVEDGAQGEGEPDWEALRPPAAHPGRRRQRAGGAVGY